MIPYQRDWLWSSYNLLGFPSNEFSAPVDSYCILPCWVAKEIIYINGMNGYDSVYQDNLCLGLCLFRACGRWYFCLVFLELTEASSEVLKHSCWG